MEYNLVFLKYFILNNEDPYLEFQSFLKSDKAGWPHWLFSLDQIPVHTVNPPFLFQT